MLVFEICNGLGCPCVEISPFVSLLRLPLLEIKVIDKPFSRGLIFRITVISVHLYFLNFLRLLFKHMQSILERVMMGLFRC